MPLSPPLRLSDSVPVRPPARPCSSPQAFTNSADTTARRCTRAANYPESWCCLSAAYVGLNTTFPPRLVRSISLSPLPLSFHPDKHLPTGAPFPQSLLSKAYCLCQQDKRDGDEIEENIEYLAAILGNSSCSGTSPNAPSPPRSLYNSIPRCLASKDYRKQISRHHSILIVPLLTIGPL